MQFYPTSILSIFLVKPKFTFIAIVYSELNPLAIHYFYILS